MDLFQVSDEMKGSSNDPIVQLAVLTNEVLHLRREVQQLACDVRRWQAEVHDSQQNATRLNRVIDVFQFIWTGIALFFGIRNP